MFETILHQTLEDQENPDYVEDNGPFPVKDYKSSYLGQGYYFWDNHLDLAHWWGEVHYRGGNYIICEADFIVKETDFCDLVGSRKAHIYIQKVIEEMGLGQLNMGQIIEFLKEIDAKPGYKGIFPYKAIRAIDIGDSHFTEMIYKFVGNKKGIITLTPRILICLVRKDVEILKNFKIVYPEKYTN